MVKWKPNWLFFNLFASLSELTHKLRCKARLKHHT
ncbi:TPA: hypothetical protein GRR93_22110 [Vibrio parahaemolyticus]|nr:hypothetical protein [Vibrio parahaemolyticus]EGR1180735.1 hypothetical protein [Vibrio parahaemolyticus]HAS6490202.1 hypothetical protein [Vibrio parahaemolyticus]